MPCFRGAAYCYATLYARARYASYATPRIASDMLPPLLKMLLLLEDPLLPRAVCRHADALMPERVADTFMVAACY